MNKYLSTLIFYVSAFGIIFILNKISPNQQDSGLGFGGLAMLLMPIIVVGLLLFNIYKGFSVNKEYFIIAGIHFLTLVIYLQIFFYKNIKPNELLIILFGLVFIINIVILQYYKNNKPMGATKTTHFSDRQNKLAMLAKALGHPARVAILEYLLKKNACVCGDIVKELPLAQATVSQHLKELKSVGIIKGEIEGNSVCYCIDYEVLGSFISIFTDFIKEKKIIVNCEC